MTINIDRLEQVPSIVAETVQAAIQRKAKHLVDYFSVTGGKVSLSRELPDSLPLEDGAVIGQIVCGIEWISLAIDAVCAGMRFGVTREEPDDCSLTAEVVGCFTVHPCTQAGRWVRRGLVHAGTFTRQYIEETDDEQSYRKFLGGSIAAILNWDLDLESPLTHELVFGELLEFVVLPLSRIAESVQSALVMWAFGDLDGADAEKINSEIILAGAKQARTANCNHYRRVMEDVGTAIRTVRKMLASYQSQAFDISPLQEAVIACWRAIDRVGPRIAATEAGFGTVSAFTDGREMMETFEAILSQLRALVNTCREVAEKAEHSKCLHEALGRLDAERDRVARLVERLRLFGIGTFMSEPRTNAEQIELLMKAIYHEVTGGFYATRDEDRTAQLIALIRERRFLDEKNVELRPEMEWLLECFKAFGKVKVQNGRMERIISSETQQASHFFALLYLMLSTGLEGVAVMTLFESKEGAKREVAERVAEMIVSGLEELNLPLDLFVPMVGLSDLTKDLGGTALLTARDIMGALLAPFRSRGIQTDVCVGLDDRELQRGGLRQILPIGEDIRRLASILRLGPEVRRVYVLKQGDTAFLDFMDESVARQATSIRVPRQLTEDPIDTNPAARELLLRIQQRASAIYNAYVRQLIFGQLLASTPNNWPVKMMRSVRPPGRTLGGGSSGGNSLLVQWADTRAINARFGSGVAGFSPHDLGIGAVLREEISAGNLELMQLLYETSDTFRTWIDVRKAFLPRWDLVNHAEYVIWLDHRGEPLVRPAKIDRADLIDAVRQITRDQDFNPEPSLTERALRRYLARVVVRPTQGYLVPGTGAARAAKYLAPAIILAGGSSA